MMKHHNHIPAGVFSAFGFLLLIVDGKTAFHGAVQGIELCIRTVIPSLFPFFILSAILTGSLSGQQLKLLAPIGKLLRIPPGSEGIFLIGILGGYPTGAQSIAIASQNGQLNLSDSRRMMGFCNNAGPAFIFGMLGPMFSSRVVPLFLWIIHILSALITGMILPGNSSNDMVSMPADKQTIHSALEKGIRTTAYVCGWIILFRVILAFLDHWFLWMFPNQFKIIISGFLELSNGCVSLAAIPNEHLRFIIASCFLGFGGICVLMQTSSVASQTGLGMYLPGKLLQTSISLILAVIVQNMLFDQTQTGIFLILPLLTLLFLIFIIFYRNTSRNPALNDV